MITEPLRNWSLRRVQFLLAHIEDFIDDEEKELRERARAFASTGGLDRIERLVDCEPTDPALPTRVLGRLTPFFDSGLLLQRGPAAENANWWATDLFWRGNVFHLQLADQVRADKLVPEVPPLQVHKAAAAKTLELLNMRFLAPGPDADAYLLKPTPSFAYVLISNLAAPWSVDHVAHAHRLINKCFIY